MSPGSILEFRYRALFGLRVSHSLVPIFRRRLGVGILRWVNLLTLSASWAIDSTFRLGFNRPLVRRFILRCRFVRCAVRIPP